MLGTAGELAARVGGRVAGDPKFPIASISAIDDATAETLTFATTPTYLHAALASRAGAVLVDEALVAEAKPGDRKPLIIVANARAAFAQLLRFFERPRRIGPFRHSSAVVAEDAEVGNEVYIGPCAVIDAKARIGDRCFIGAGAYIGEDVSIGEDSILHPHATVHRECVVGKRAILHPGAVIGSDGFGFVFLNDHYERIPQIGNVVLGDDVEIGANSCVDRAQTGSTRIGDGTKIDNQVQIGHNCRIGMHTAMAAQSGMAGSSIIGDYVRVGGKVGFVGHNVVGSHVTIAGDSMVWGNLRDGSVVSGRPARPHGEHLRQEVVFKNLPKLVARVEALEKKLEQ